MIYGYSRVSTITQLKHGHSLESQNNQLKEAGAEEIYEDGFTGTKNDRPNLNKLLDKLKEGDTLVVTKLDRVARSMLQGNKLINDLLKKGIKVNILNIGLMDNTPSSKLIRNIFFSFAEFERDMIVERTQEGKAIAKLDKDFKEGRRRTYNDHQLDHAVKLLENHTYKEVVKMTGISKSTIIREVRKQRESEQVPGI